MVHFKFQGHGTSGSEKILKVMTIYMYGHIGRLVHVIEIISLILSPLPLSQGDPTQNLDLIVQVV